ncbi:GntR family transcriptional regulator [Alcaligenaceae bacterium]|nr:GntR family transcriptional regulator [Alcaligenaceae bacterium]
MNEEVGRALSADAITSELRTMILSGAYPIGVQLKQEALAKRFGVSRIPVREALKRLQVEGLVEHTPHQGSIVAGLTIPQLLETLDIRIGLETRALKLAIPNMQESDFRAAEDILARYDQSDSPREWAELNLEFHMCLYRPCALPRLLKMIEEMVRGIAMHLRALQSYRVGRKLPQSEHREILKACMAQDADLAVKLLEQHVDHTKEVLKSAA